jgi:hypothetical protein
MGIPAFRRRGLRRAWVDDQTRAVGAGSDRDWLLVECDNAGSTEGATPTVWPLNSAAPDRGDPCPRGAAAGHRHLHCLLSVHAVVRREGVATAFRLLTPAQIADAITACGYFDLHDLAATVADIPLAASSPLSARVFDAEYHRRYSTTDTLVTAIRATIAARPHDFPTTAVERRPDRRR